VRDIFAEEARAHLDTLMACLQREPTLADDPLLRSIHTLRGGAHVAGLAELGELFDPLDAATRAANAAARHMLPAERELLLRLCPLLEEYIACSMRPDEHLVARTAALRDEALALAAATKAAATGPDAQAEARVARFLEEALERLFHAHSLLDAWRSGQEPRADALAAELRKIHQRAEQLEVPGVTALSGVLLSAAERIDDPQSEDPALLETAIEAFLDALDRLAAGQQPSFDPVLLDALAALAARPREPMAVQVLEPVPEALTAEMEPLRARIARELQQADPELLGIFLEEAAELLVSIDQGIDDWRHDRDNREPFERLQRDLHTLKGGARMAGLRHLGELSHNVETFLINQGVQFGSFDDAFFQRVHDYHEQLLQVMDLVRGEPGAVALPADAAAGIEAAPAPEAAQPPEAAAPEAAESAEPQFAPEPLIEAAVADQLLAEEVPDSAAAPVTARERIARDLASADPELLGIFLEEAEELMASVDTGIDAWRGDRGNRALFDKLQRDLHTLKGGARMAGISVLGDLAHDFESMLIAEAANPAGLPDAFFLRVADFHEQLARAMDVVRGRPEPGSPEPVAAIPGPVAVEAPVAVPAAPEPAPAEPVAASEPPQPVLPAKAPQPVPAAAVAKPRDEVVRVSSQLLEDLVNLAGETSISRGRVEEQVSELGQLFGDMQSTIERLQSQVRRLDIATEAQILFRRERAETAGAEGFDPLEMDRYSQLQQLSRSLVESASDILDIKRTLSEKTRDLETVLIQQSRINSQLQEGLMRSRMVPFASILPRIRRVVRQVASELDKNVELELGKMEGELDRGILERVVAPLEHMLRNAVDHGIESREQRRAAGKPETGRIRIDVSREGGDVLLALSDDGAGVNIAAVRRKAIERGLMAPEAPLGDHEITQFILHSGFSTAEKVTQISGRGVGMDVVSSEIRQMGGSLEIQSTPGKGSRFVIRLPFTVSVSRSLMVNVGTDTYALPLNTVEGVVRMPARDMARYTGPDAELLSYAGQSYAVRHLGELLYPGEQVDVGDLEENVPVVLVRAGGQALAVEVGRLVGAREIVVKGLGPQFGAVPGLSGATVLGDGSVVLILDIPAMLRADSARGTQSSVELARTEAAPQAERPPLVMVVDDSVTVRKVTTRFLEREGMRVITAKDGAEAMVMLQEQVPDLMLLDIEMPHMDGFEVLSKLRLSDALRQLPVIMITSRTGDKHRERALSLGANMYLGKPYQESVLLEHIGRLLGRGRLRAGS
jgi:chemosensory pili system protein ChpA (sensor histidine kinase/response regulator)